MRYIPLLLLTLLCTCVRAQIPYLHLSPKQTITQRAGMTDVKVEYSRPHMRGRKIFGDLVPMGQRWRAGANINTKVTFSRPVTIGETELPKGTYALLTKPDNNSWEVYFYQDTDLYGIPETWEEDKVAATLTVTPEATGRTVSRLTYSIDDMTDDAFVLALTWENTRVPVPIRLTTDKDILAVLDGPSSEDFYRATQYHLYGDKDLSAALGYADKAIAMKPKRVYYYHQLRAEVLVELGRTEDAVAAVKTSLKLATEDENEYGVESSKELITEYEAMLKN